ncbi:hypothetical protein [Bacillus toyonensis]|nr:hypothetical protein [Bacillus toyonensis]
MKHKLGGVPYTVCKNCNKETVKTMMIPICTHCKKDFRKKHEATESK